LTSTTLNTPGTTPNVAWEDGLYLITGSISGPANGQHVVTRLLVNSNVVEESIQGDTSYETNLLEHLAFLNAGDTISFQYRTPAGGIVIDPAADWQGASLSLIRFQQTPEPASIALWSLIGLGLVGFGYRRLRRTK
jgi:hypothetical protein